MFITIGYGDSVGYECTDPVVRDAAHMLTSGLATTGC